MTKKYDDREVDLLHDSECQWEVSFYDIVRTEEYQNFIKHREFNSDKTEEIIGDSSNVWCGFPRMPDRYLVPLLYKLGLDTEYLPDRQICQHKTWEGIVVEGERFVGLQRTDKEWLYFKNSVNLK